MAQPTFLAFHDAEEIAEFGVAQTAEEFAVRVDDVEAVPGGQIDGLPLIGGDSQRAAAQVQLHAAHHRAGRRG